jgi:hypothetical protein
MRFVLSSHTLDRDWSETSSTQHGHEEPRMNNDCMKDQGRAITVVDKGPSRVSAKPAMRGHFKPAIAGPEL